MSRASLLLQKMAFRPRISLRNKSKIHTLTGHRKAFTCFDILEMRSYTSLMVSECVWLFKPPNASLSQITMNIISYLLLLISVYWLS